MGNVAPLPLLLSVLLLAYTLTMYAKRCLPADKRLLPALGMGFLVVANPYFLSNLSYQFDNMTMTLALCAAILPYAMPQERALYKVFLFSFFLCMITFTTYQPCCGIYISLWFLELFFMLLNGRIDVPRLFIRAAACGFSVFVYKYAILNHYIRPSGGSWQFSAYQFSWRSEGGISSAVKQNFQLFLSLVEEYLRGVPTPVLLFFGLLIFLGMVCMAFTLFSFQTPSFRKVLSLLYMSALPIGMLLAAILPLLVLTPSIFNISAHSLICLGGLGLWAGIMFSALYRRLPRLSILFFLPCLFFGFTFSYTYGNAMTSQKQYEEYLAGCIVYDVGMLNADGTHDTLTLAGKAPRSQETARLSQKYPLFRRIVPSHLNSSSYIGRAMVMRYAPSAFGQTFSFEGLSEEEETLIQNSDPILANSAYACYKSENKIIIYFQSNAPQ